MARPACSEEKFIELFTLYGPHETARQLGTHIRNVFRRRESIEKRSGRAMFAPSRAPTVEHPDRQPIDIESGVILVAGDAHYWPGVISTAHRAFVRACKDMAPKAVIMNGDVFDGASVSRHAPIGWEDRPSVQEEIGACYDRLSEILDASPGAKHIWPLGNHDARFESSISNRAPEYANVKGVHLKDHFPEWAPCWSCWINDDVVVKHRGRGGIHATHNNTLNAGKTIVTNHLHSAKVTPFSDYNGTRWGVDTGTLADIYGPQFRAYMEDNARNWRSAFAVLTFYRGELLWPELVHVRGPGEVEFRGKVYEV